MRWRLVIKGFLLLATLVALGWAFEYSGLRQILVDKGWIDHRVRGHGFMGELLFLGVGGLIATALPRQFVCFLAGYAFGLGWGLPIAALAQLIGCMLVFFYARLLGRELVLHHCAARVRRIDRLLEKSPFATTLTIRFLPIGNNFLTNLLAGVSAVKSLPFLAGSLIGYLPQTIIFVLLGSGIRVQTGLRIAMAAALFTISAGLGLLLLRRWREANGEIGTKLGATADGGL